MKRRWMLREGFCWFFGLFVYRIGDIRTCLMDYRKDLLMVGKLKT